MLEYQEEAACDFIQANCTGESIFDYASFHFCLMYEAGLEWLSFIILVRGGDAAHARDGPTAQRPNSPPH